MLLNTSGSVYKHQNIQEEYSCLSHRVEYRNFGMNNFKSNFRQHERLEVINKDQSEQRRTIPVRRPAGPSLSQQIWIQRTVQPHVQLHHVRASCIATGHPESILTSEDEIHSPDEDYASMILEHWPFPAEATIIGTSSLEVAPTSASAECVYVHGHTLTNTALDRRTRGHVKQSASCGSPFVSATFCQTPRAAPLVPFTSHTGRKTSLNTALLNEHKQSRLRSDTVQYPSTGLVRSLVGSIKRAYSLNDSKRTHNNDPQVATSQIGRPRGRSSVRASLNKALPPLLPDIELSAPEQTGQLVQSTDAVDFEAGPRLTVLEIDSFLHDLTIANSPFLNSCEVEEVLLHHDTWVGQDRIIV